MTNQLGTLSNETGICIPSDDVGTKLALNTGTPKDVLTDRMKRIRSVDIADIPINDESLELVFLC